MMSHEDIFELVPLYALDALDGDEQAEVEAHVGHCDECAQELSRHRAVAATFTADETAPTGVWERIVAEIESGVTVAEPTDIDTARRRGGRSPLWMTAVAAALALVLGVVTVVQRQELAEMAGPQGIIAAAEDAAATPGAIVGDFTTESGVVGRVILTPDGEGYILPTDLEPLPSDRTYQLWVITSDEVVISAGVLGNDPGPARFTWTGEVAGFALTREVAGGVMSSAGDVVSVVET